jgi:hypothetical protein
MNPGYGIAALIRAMKRHDKIRATVGMILTGYLTTLLANLLDGWLLMLAIGVARAQWLANLPTIGYWWAVVLVALLRGTFSRIRDIKPKDGTQ